MRPIQERRRLRASLNKINLRYVNWELYTKSGSRFNWRKCQSVLKGIQIKRIIDPIQKNKFKEELKTNQKA